MIESTAAETSYRMVEPLQSMSSPPSAGNRNVFIVDRVKLKRWSTVRESTVTRSIVRLPIFGVLVSRGMVTLSKESQLTTLGMMPTMTVR